MHFECTIVETDDFIAEDWDLRVVFCAPHRDCHLRSVTVFCGTNLHVAMSDKDVVNIKGSFMVRISIRCEDERSFNIDE